MDIYFMITFFEFIGKSSAKRIGSWVHSHHSAINNSVNKWKELSLCGTKTIVYYIWNVNSAGKMMEGWKTERTSMQSNK